MRAMSTKLRPACLLLLAAAAGAHRFAAPAAQLRAQLPLHPGGPRPPLRMTSSAEATELDAFGSTPMLPALSVREELTLREGERVEHVVMPGGSTGSGVSVQDVRASPADVFRAVSAFGGYAARIKTVRAVTVSSQAGENTRALIEVSRFKLKLYVNFTTYAPARYVAWTLDRDVPTPFIRECVGYWHVEDLGNARPGWSRVWFVVRVRLRPFVPKVIEGLVARVGLRRATTWIQSLAEPQPPGGDAPPRGDGGAAQGAAGATAR